MSNYLTKITDQYPVLSQDNRRELMEAAKNGCLESRDELVLSYLRLVIKIANGFTAPNPFTAEDLISEGLAAVMDSIDKYDKDRNDNITFYIGQCIEWKLKKTVRAWELRETLSLNVPSFDVDEDSEELVYTIPDTNTEQRDRDWQAKSDMVKLLTCLPEEKQIALILTHGLFGFGHYGIVELGRLLGVSRQTIWNWNAKSLEYLSDIASDSEIVPTLYPLASPVRIQGLLNEEGIEPKHTKKTKKPKIQRRSRIHPSVDLTPIEHNFTFKSGHKPTEFLKQYGDAIRADAALGCGDHVLHKKYCCPVSTVKKALEIKC